MTCGMSRLRLENHLYTTPSTPILKVQEAKQKHYCRNRLIKKPTEGMQLEEAKLSRDKHEGFSVPTNRHHTINLERSEMHMRSTSHTRLERLYGVPEVLLEIAVFTVILGTAFVMCMLRRQIAG